jgi:hypothetical protein
LEQTLTKIGEIDMRIGLCLFLAAASMILNTPSLQAKECARCKLMAAWGLASQPATLFNADDVARYEGQVVSVQDVKAEAGVVDGVYALIKTPDGNLAVRLGPAWYLDRQGFQVEPRQQLEVMASKVTIEEDHPALVATKAKIGSKTIALRSAKGVAVWDGLDKPK